MPAFKLVAGFVVLAIVLPLAARVASSEEAQVENSSTEQPGPSAEQLEAWLVGLDSHLYAERERATDALLAAGGGAVPYLKRAALGESLEAADRAVWVLQQLADTNEQSVKLSALDVLVSADRFPTVAREAEAALAELQAELCSEHLQQLGAEFLPHVDRLYTTEGIGTILDIRVNTNREEWTGETVDLLLLTKLRRVGKLMIASRDLDDEAVKKLAAIDGITSITLIETNVSGETLQKLKEQYPGLRLVVHTRAKLGVQFVEGQPLTVTQVLPNSPAQKAGMRTGDHVTKFAGKPVESFDQLTAIIAQHAPGESVEIAIERGNEELTLTAELGGTDWWEELKGKH